MRPVLLFGLLLAGPALAAPITEIVSRSPPVLPREAYALPPGSSHVCSAVVTLNAMGVPSQVGVSGCDPLFFPAMQDALLLWRWRVRAFDEPIPPTLEVTVDVPFRVPDVPAQRSTRIIRVPDSDGVSNTAVAPDASGALTELTLEEALAAGMLGDHPMPALRAPLPRPCVATVTFAADGTPVHASAGDCPAEASQDVMSGLWRWRAVPAAQGSTRRVKVPFPAR